MIKFQKKIKILLYFLFCVLFLSACGKKNQETIPSNLVEKSNLNSFFLENKFKLVNYFWDCFIYKKIKSIKLNLQKKI